MLSASSAGITASLRTLQNCAIFARSLSGSGGSVALSNNGALTVNQGTNTSYAGAITGSGSLTKSGSGTLTLTGTNTYTGGTTVSGGTLAGTTSTASHSVSSMRKCADHGDCVAST